MSLLRRNNTIFSTASDADLQTGGSYTIGAYRPGGVVQSVTNLANNFKDITFYSGHGFQVDDVMMPGVDPTAIGQVYVVTGNVVNARIGGSITTGDVMFNLGTDSTGTAYDGSDVPIYSTPDTTTAIADSQVVCGEDGEYGYWHDGSQNIWELVRDGTGAPVDVVMGAYVTIQATSPTSKAVYLSPTLPDDITQGSGSVGLFFDKPSTTSGAMGASWCRDGVERWALGEDFYTGDRSYWALWSDLGTTGTSGDIFGVSWYGAETSALHGGTGGTAVPKWFFNSAPYGNYDSAWTFNFHGASTSGGKRSALFQDSSYATTNGGVDVYFAGNPINGLELRNEDGTNYRSTIRFCRTTTAGGGTINGAYVLGMGIGTGAATFQLYDEINSSTRYFVSAAGNSLWSNAVGTYTPTYVFDFLSEGTTVNAPVNSFALRYRASTGTPAIGLGLYQAFRVPDAAGTDTRAGSVGVVVTSATAGSLKAMTQLWSSYGTAAVLNVTDARKVLINTTSETNATAITIALDADNHAAVTMAASTATPANPSSSSEGRIYVKGGKFVIQYNDAGTVRWKYLDLTGTGVTWTHTTSAP